MQILFVSSEAPGRQGGGLATYTWTMSRALAARGHDVHILTCAPGRARSDREEEGCTVHERPIVSWPWLGRLLRLPATSRGLRTAVSVDREARRLGFSPDIVQVADYGAEGLLLCHRHLPMVVRISSPTSLLLRPDRRIARIDRWLVSRLERHVTRRATSIISPSSHTKALLEAMGWVRCPATVLRTPVWLERWDAIPPPSAAPPTVIAVGRVEHQKGIDRLIEAVSRLTDLEGVRVVLAGRTNGRRDGVDYATWVTGLAAERSVALEQIGPVHPGDLPEVLGRARALAMVSRFDNFPNAALEAMAAGRPIVCTPGTGVDEILQGTDAGTVCEPSPESIADALRPLLADPALADRKGAAARRLVAELCDPDAIASSWEALATTVLGEADRA